MPRPRLFTASATAATVAAAAAVATVVSVASPAVASAAPGLSAPGRTQVSVDGTWTGLHVGTPNENEARYSLSLTKLLIADYVFEHGGAQDREKARNMVRYSDDNLATELSQKYPQAIPSKVEQYGMTSAVPASTWGNWKFSSADWSRYLSAKHREDPTATGPLLSAMRESSTVAADGYGQRYGVALLPGVLGWKSGWSDDRTTYHASTGFGGGWTVAVQTTGTRGDLDADLAAALSPAGLIPDPGSLATMTLWPAREVARQGVQATADWVGSVVGPVDPATARAIADSITTAGEPVVAAVPETIPLPGVIAAALPGARA
ncbi:hypothetical protein [Corynebacterium provencense]|uniref:hypothetical protein n=1 Tax=Corynebacterium provencense TaxID=1737425 RepID=UPI0009900BCE|nr:hypothetical protein [Corynebacterium provencense]